MTEMLQIIAEAEGARTPTKKRTRKDVEAAFENFTKKKVAKKAARKKPVTDHQIISTPALRNRKLAEAPASPATSTPAITRVAEPVKMNFISPTGYVREVGYDPKTKLFYVAFGKSTLAFPSSPEEWAAFEVAVADSAVEIDAYYRRAFRKRTGWMNVRTEVTK